MTDGGDDLVSSPELERASELVDALGETVSQSASRLGFELVKRLALAREELEDIWAEAQALSRQGRDRSQGL